MATSEFYREVAMQGSQRYCLLDLAGLTGIEPEPESTPEPTQQTCRGFKVVKGEVTTEACKMKRDLDEHGYCLWHIDQYQPQEPEDPGGGAVAPADSNGSVTPTEATTDTGASQVDISKMTEAEARAFIWEILAKRKLIPAEMLSERGAYPIAPDEWPEVHVTITGAEGEEVVEYDSIIEGEPRLIANHEEIRKIIGRGRIPQTVSTDTLRAVKAAMARFENGSTKPDKLLHAIAHEVLAGKMDLADVRWSEPISRPKPDEPTTGHVSQHEADQATAQMESRRRQTQEPDERTSVGRVIELHGGKKTERVEPKAKPEPVTSPLPVEPSTTASSPAEAAVTEGERPMSADKTDALAAYAAAIVAENQATEAAERAAKKKEKELQTNALVAMGELAKMAGVEIDIKKPGKKKPKAEGSRPKDKPSKKKPKNTDADQPKGLVQVVIASGDPKGKRFYADPDMLKALGTPFALVLDNGDLRVDGGVIIPKEMVEEDEFDISAHLAPKSDTTAATPATATPDGSQPTGIVSSIVAGYREGKAKKTEKTKRTGF